MFPRLWKHLYDVYNVWDMSEVGMLALIVGFFVSFLLFYKQVLTTTNQIKVKHFADSNAQGNYEFVSGSNEIYIHIYSIYILEQLQQLSQLDRNF